MIYIFDDRAQRRKENELRLRKFSCIVSFSTVDATPEKRVEDVIIDSMSDPDCVLFHKSYVFADRNVTFEAVRQLFTSFDVPVVIFSGGTEGNNKSGSEINMNADLMYENLPYFLEDFQTNGKINIDTLLWGKRYRLNELLQIQNKISAQYLINNAPEDIVDNIDKLKRSILALCRKDHKSLGDSIVADIEKNPKTTWLDVADIIDNNIQKFF